MNFDGSPRLRLEQNPLSGALFRATGKTLFPGTIRYGDIVAGLPVEDGSVDAVYSSHVLEHLYRDDLPRALANTWRVLRPGGVFRLVLPDLEWRMRAYVAAQDGANPAAAEAFMRGTLLGVATAPRGPEGYLRAAIGNAEHRWMYDFGSMKAHLEAAGFVGIRRCAIGDSGDPMFDRVESHDRFFAPGGEAKLDIHCERALS